MLQLLDSDALRLCHVPGVLAAASRRGEQEAGQSRDEAGGSEAGGEAGGPAGAPAAAAADASGDAEPNDAPAEKPKKRKKSSKKREKEKAKKAKAKAKAKKAKAKAKAKRAKAKKAQKLPDLSDVHPRLRKHLQQLFVPTAGNARLKAAQALSPPWASRTAWTRCRARCGRRRCRPPSCWQRGGLGIVHKQLCGGPRARPKLAALGMQIIAGAIEDPGQGGSLACRLAAIEPAASTSSSSTRTRARRKGTCFSAAPRRLSASLRAGRRAGRGASLGGRPTEALQAREAAGGRTRSRSIRASGAPRATRWCARRGAPTATSAAPTAPPSAARKGAITTRASLAGTRGGRV